MIGVLLTETTQRQIESFLGENFELRHLHPWYVRFGRTYVQERYALPQAYKLVTPSGRILKLHLGDDKRRFQHMATRASQAETTNLFPDVLWRNDQALLMEFIPGQLPDFGGEEFARALGRCLASLHQIMREPCDEARIDAGVKRDLALLSESGVIRGVELERHAEALREAKPRNLSCSMDYTDVKPGNFLWDAERKLRFIDLGALRAHRPTGQYLCGSFKFRRLRRKAFSEAYLQAGGIPQVIEHARYLRMLNCIWAAALYTRKMREVPAYLPLHKLIYRLMAGNLLREFRHLAEKPQNDLIAI